MDIHQLVSFVAQFDDGRVDLTQDLNAASIKEFITGNRLPLVTEFTQESAPKIFGGDVKNHLLLFVSKKSDSFQDKYDVFKTLAPNFRGKVGGIIFLINLSSYLSNFEILFLVGKCLMEFFGLVHLVSLKLFFIIFFHY